MTYEWREWSDFDGQRTGLLPVGESNPHSNTRIASIFRRPNGQYVAAYYFPKSTGNNQSGSGYFKTPRGAQRWVERNLEMFWEPPTIFR